MLIADSGSTKTDWAWIENGTIVHRATTAGINPVHQTEEEILVECGVLNVEGEMSQDYAHCSNLTPHSTLLISRKITFSPL